MSDNGIVWEEPPSPLHGRKDEPWIGRLTPLMARPGTWARVRELDTSNAAYAAVSTLRRGLVRIPEGEWEFVARTVGGQGYVYARYLSGADR